MFTIVLATLIVVSIIVKGPVIFLKLCQTNYGEIDAFITPAGTGNIYPYNQVSFLNYSVIEEVVGKSSFNISPRKIISYASLYKQ